MQGIQANHPQVGLAGDADMGGAAVPVVVGAVYTGIGAAVGGTIGYLMKKKRTGYGALIGAAVGLGWSFIDMSRKPKK